MKSLFFFLILLTKINNVSYASFPIITGLLKIIKDTLKKESVDAYHLRMQKMGFDFNSCNCESYRAGYPYCYRRH